MNERTKARRRNGGAQGEAPETQDFAAPLAGTAEGEDERRDKTFESVFERWSFGVAKEGLAEELGTTGALLRGAVALREMQIAAARRTQEMHELAGKRLASARSLTDVTSIGLMVTQADAEAVVRYWTDMAGIVTKSGIESWNEALASWTRLQGTAASFGQHWLETAASASMRPEMLEAEVQHVTTPVTSSPFVWPAQEAVREAMTLGARNWSEWIGNAVPGMAQITQIFETVTAQPKH
jgi:hypothetical protein